MTPSAPRSSKFTRGIRISRRSAYAARAKRQFSEICETSLKPPAHVALAKIFGGYSMVALPRTGGESFGWPDSTIRRKPRLSGEVRRSLGEIPRASCVVKPALKNRIPDDVDTPGQI